MDLISISDLTWGQTIEFAIGAMLCFVMMTIIVLWTAFGDDDNDNE
jgi:hypothetical protein